MIIDRKSNRVSRTRQGGVGIIEVLVALVVVSFGVLGMASLQLTGMKHSSGGFNRSKALLFAQSAATRIRLNTQGVIDADYAGFDSAAVDCNIPPPTYCQARKGVSATPSCSTTELAAFDMFTVSCGDLGDQGANKGVIGTLPNGQLTVSCMDLNCPAGSTYQISVTWTEGRARTNADEMVSRRVQVRLKP